MSRFGSSCPFCRAYNAKGDTRCSRCDAWLPPPFVATPLLWLKTTENASTMVLGGINIVVFVLMVVDAMRATGSTSGVWTIPTSTMIRFGAMGFGFEVHEPLRYLSACFVHLSLMHIGFNMLALADLGRAAEVKVGSLRLVAAYVVTGVGGFFASRLWYGPLGPVTAGASGAIFGLYGIVIASLAMRRDKEWKSILFRVVLNSFVWYFVLHTNQAAHIGGLVVGLAMGALFELERRPWRRDWALAIFAAVSLLATLASLVAAQRSPGWALVRAREEERRAPREPRSIIPDRQTPALPKPSGS